MSEEQASLFRIEGADRNTGEDVRVIILAADETAAVREANCRGVLVSSCLSLASWSKNELLLELTDTDFDAQKDALSDDALMALIYDGAEPRHREQRDGQAIA